MNSYGLKFLLIISLGIIVVEGNAQGTTCAGATALTVNGACGSTALTNAANTVADPGCLNGDQVPNREVWYSYTVSGGPLDVSVSVTYTGNNNVVVQVFSGSCGSLTEVGCANALGGAAGTETAVVNGQANGTYLIRIAGRGNNTVSSICVTGTAAVAPANDNCSGAVTLTPGAAGGSCSTTAGTYSNATQSQTGCAGTADDDVWYKFVATATSHTVTVDPGTSTDPVMQIFSGSCASLTSLICDDGGGTDVSETHTLTGLTIGNTYFVRTYSYSSTATTTPAFTICVTTPGAGPANDECSGAVTLTPGATCTTTSGTYASATQSQTGCTGTADDDVWYKFVATGTSHTFTVDPGTSADIVVQMFSGACGSLTSLNCDDDAFTDGTETETVGGLTIGNTYYVRTYTYSSSVTSTPAFTICITNPPPGPANDECSGAVTLTPGATCSATSGTVDFSGSSGITGCVGTANDDVWYTFTAASTTQYINLTTTMDAVMQVFSGSCASPSSVQCSDPNSMTVTGLTVGTTYKVRVYSYSSSAPADGDFTICITNPPTCPSGLGTTVSVASLPYTSTGRTTCGKGNEITSTNAATCGSSSYFNGEDEVFVFTPTTSGQITITQSNTTGTVGIMLYAGCPFTTACVAQSQGSTAPRSICYNVTAGVTYYIIADSYPSPACYSYDISITAPSGGATTCSLNYTTSSIAKNATNAEYTGGTSVTLTDDYFANAYSPIGFSFCFDGITYTQCLISSNGYIIFDKVGCVTNLPGYTQGAPSGYSPYSFDVNLPDITESPRNAVLLTWQDINPNIGGTIKYQTTGTAPNRVFIASFNDVPYYSCTSLKFKGMIKLYETTNVIELHIDNKEVCSTWNGGNAVLGLQNFDGTIARIPANRNGLSADWTTTNEAWRFTPSCATCTTPLPVKLVEFTAVNKGSFNDLKWTTSSEINNSHFVIQHSADGNTFTEIGTVEGNGTSNEKHQYTFKDESPFRDVTYYRLVQYDYNGELEFSDVITVRTTATRTFDLVDAYPVPSSDRINVNMNMFNEGIVKLEVLHVTGNVMLSETVQVEKGTNSRVISISDLPSGVYMLKATLNGGDSQLRKIIKR